MKFKNYFGFLFFLVLFSLILTFNVSALGITPSKEVIIFSSGLEGTYSYMVQNTGKNKVAVDLYIRGDLKDYFELSEKSLILNSGEKKTFSMKMKLPQTIEKPGLHQQRIGALESMSNMDVEGGVGVGSRVGVESIFDVRVPFPGKYAELKIKTVDVALGEPVKFYVTALNYGLDKLNEVTIKINIYNSENKKVQELTSEKFSLEQSGSKEVLLQLDTKDINAGIYTAKVAVEYDGGGKVEDSIGFKVGELVAKVKKVNYEKITKDSVAKLNIELESQWNSKIENAYLQLDVYSGSGEKIGTQKSESFILNPWTTTTINMLWDTSGVAPGTYDAKLILNYAGKASEYPFKIKIGSGSTIIWIIAGLAVAVLLYFILRKKKER
ncbi:hypothetical protein J4403_02930 [Candidatus Woesearchaeota archaeon]|nr:hypothetical protein [Candidatus Woesearchaeota archaeon]